MGKVKLTEQQREILRWIDTQPHNHTWRNPDESLTLKGPNGEMKISLFDNDRLSDMVEPNPDSFEWRKKHFVLTDLGRSALADEGRGT